MSLGGKLVLCDTLNLDYSLHLCTCTLALGAVRCHVGLFLVGLFLVWIASPAQGAVLNCAYPTRSIALVWVAKLLTLWSVIATLLANRWHADCTYIGEMHHTPRPSTEFNPRGAVAQRQA